jgi:outer membrane protein assembly factor BamA
LDELDYLAEVPLPGEGPPPERPAGTAELEALVGRSVISVVAVDPPAGFNPVDDAGVPLGIEFDAAVARKAVARLWASGNYRDIRVYGRPATGGVELMIAVEPLIRIHSLDVKGNKALDDAEVARAIDFSPDRTIVPDQSALIALRNKLVAAYAEHGYREAGATLKLLQTAEPGQVDLLVEVDEGRPERYTVIRIPNLPDDLIGEPLTKEIGLKPGTVRNREKVGEAIEELARVLALYGYRDAAVGKPEEARLGKYRFELTIPVEFGLRTQIRFVGNHYLRSDELLEQLAPKDLFATNPASVSAGTERLRQHYRRYGFFHAQITAGRLCHQPEGEHLVEPPSRPCRSESTEQDLVFRIAEGPQVEVADVLFEGNSHFSDEDLKGELFGFMLEKNPRDEAFQQIDTETVDAVGISDHRPAGTGRPRGAGAPSLEPYRVYVPELYLAAMEHLTGLYQEQGFLGVIVEDTCDLSAREPIHRTGLSFEPLVVERATEVGDYEEEGTNPCVLIDEAREAVVVVISVQEGPQTKIHELTFKGNEVLLDTDLLERTRIATGQPYNEYRLREAERDIKDLYGAKGYMFAETSFKMTPSPDMKRAQVVFQIREGEQVRAGKILVRGNSSTSRRLIIERLEIEKGDLVTPEALAESERRLMELGIFDGATVQMVAPETEDEVKNILVQVTEGKPQYMELRWGIATVEGLRGGGEYGYRNLGGWAINARLRARANYRLLFLGNEDFERRFNSMTLQDQIEHHVLVGVSTDHVPGTFGRLGLGIDGIRERTNEPAFSAERWSTYLRVKPSFKRWLPIELHTGLELGNIQLPENIETLQVQPQFQKWARMPEGESTFWVTGGSVSLDLRDDVFNPSRGLFFSVSGDLVRSLANFAPETVTNPDTGETLVVDRVSNYIRGQVTLSGYVPLSFISPKVVLMLSASAGYIFHLQSDSTTWADRYFYLGGVSTLRGFFEESLIPEDVYQDWKSRLRSYGPEAEALLEQPGGEAMFLLRSELRYPLAQSFFGAVFFEAGNLWRDQGAFEPVSVDPRFRVNLRPVAGGGLRYMTPLGPIAFDVGVNLDKRPHEDWFAWSFSIGSAF